MLSRLLNSVSIMAVVTIIAASCSSTAHIEKAAGANLSQYKTYGWLEPAEKTTSGAKSRVSMTQQHIRAAVEQQLQKAGWKPAAKRPDVLISTDLVIEKTEKESKDPVYSAPFTRTFYNRYTGRFNSFYFPSRFMGYDSYATTVKEGTVTVTLIDAKTDQAVWQGWATNELDQANISSKEINKNVQSIFKKFDASN